MDQNNAEISMRMALMILCGAALALDAAPKPIIRQEQNGRIAYDADERGNRVPDFSHCGYTGGGRAIPDVPVHVSVPPQLGDNTARIQRAIDYIAMLPADSNGIRGAVLLLRGRHEIFGGLHITNSGVVLRGQGMSETGTVLFAAGIDRRTLIRVAGRSDRTVQTNSEWSVVDEYVPVGATSLRLRSAKGLKPGDSIFVVRPSTQAWIDRLGAAEFGGGVGGGWKPGTRDIVWDRVIRAIDGDKVSVDAPITTALEKGLGGGRAHRYEWPARIHNVGIENVRLESAFDSGNPKDENHSWCAITMEHTRDAWVRQVTFKHFAGSAVAIYESGSRVTIEDCASLAPISEEGGARRNTFFTMGQQTLFLRCYAERGRHDFSAGHCAAGPNAFVQCEASLPLADSGPIESWASGVLYDNVRIDGDALTLANRGPALGAGWSAVNSVLWNCSAARIVCANPPGAQNWSFGSWAEFEGDGIWRSSNDFMTPESLYAAQLRDRLGAEAAKRLQLMPRPTEESSNPPLDKAQQLAAASHQPAPQLIDYIASASRRAPVLSEAGTAKSIDEIAPIRSGAASSAAKRLIITNGWLTCDGRLLIGGSTGVAWWRGNTHPGEAASFSPAVTRFVPGRVGRGFTDDLYELAASMIASNKAALDHNYGLWYDRRRDDHERVRRIDGKVWPPFYEQPFARSGKGRAWDGLSQYDLTKFNPWYWGRLRAFAAICDERGLVLFHQNYFQHNILEAGGHWADSPWRSTNNINETGFPEPPPYAGDKRIFMAELFYDVMHPARRALHRNYIRQCLDNFTNNGNVIQFTSAEFTGPSPFVEFWLDTIAEWRQESARDPLVALSCTKDVQDSILADPKRASMVDVIDFRYWWRTDKGEFAPPGGKNLAPRQFERQWRGGRPRDEDLAGMAAEYRAKFRDKAVICDFNSAGWAWLCAGGSMPRVPKTTDTNLLASIPRMQPWISDATGAQWSLREAGKQILVCYSTKAELDLSGESGAFRVQIVDEHTGTLKPQRETVRGGGIAKLPGDARVVWLIRE
jgi:hypothetical protein